MNGLLEFPINNWMMKCLFLKMEIIVNWIDLFLTGFFENKKLKRNFKLIIFIIFFFFLEIIL
jgi:hypothetical protein